jgi:acyl-coenzyme A synthetase/AMP-(fatty) acid ligase
MLPSRWREFDALAKNINGKIDRRAIRKHFRAELAMPRTAVGSTTSC